MDILGQAKSGMGKTAVFVLATLQQIDPVDGQVRFNKVLCGEFNHLKLLWNVRDVRYLGSMLGISNTWEVYSLKIVA